VANAIASGLGKTLIVPEHLNGLQTIEGVHLDHPSAERWSEGFFETASPEIQKCLEEHRVAISPNYTHDTGTGAELE
jgi:hypothetical protein